MKYAWRPALAQASNALLASSARPHIETRSPQCPLLQKKTLIALLKLIKY
jgi:hypothetical protein